MKVMDLFRGKIESPTAKEFLIASGDAGEFAMTEVVLDFRKEFADEDQLWSCVDTSLGHHAGLDTSLINPATGMWVDKDGRDVDITLVNGILSNLGESLAEYLDRFPILSTILGDNKRTSRKPQMVRLAKEISETGIGHYLKVITGHIADRRMGVLLDPPPVVRPRKGRTIGFGKPWLALQDSESSWGYIVRRAIWAGKQNVFIVPQPEKTPGIRLRVGPTTVNLDSITFTVTMPQADGSSLGFVDITMPGGTKKRARHIIRSNNADFGSSDEIRGVSLVSVLDILGERLAELAWQGERALEKGEYISKKEHDLILDRISKTIDEFSHIAGMSEKGDRVLKEANIDDWEASVILPRAATPSDTMDLTKILAQVIVDTEFRNPLNPTISHMFSTAMTSKNKPMTVVSMLPPLCIAQSPDGPKEVLLEHPMLRYVVNGWVDTDRQNRESRSVRFACTLDTPTRIWFTNGLEDYIPSITRRRRDAVVVALPGDHWFFSDKSANGDMGRPTPWAMENIYKRPSRPDVRGPISGHQLDLLVEEICGPDKTVEDLRAAGWKVDISARRVGRFSRRTVYEAMYTCVGPSIGDPTWNKLYLCGHKFVGVPTEHDYSVKVGDTWYNVAVFVPIESLQQKKLHGSMVAGLNVLLGADYIAPDSVIIHPERVDGDSPDAYDDMVHTVANKLNELGLPDHGRMPIYRADGQFMGDGWAGVYPTFVLREDDKISTGVSTNGCSRSALLTRMLGETIDLSRRDSLELFALANFVSNADPLIELEDTTLESVPVPASTVPAALRVQ